MKRLVTANWESVNALEFRDLRAGDIVLIRTRNNLYSFLVGNQRTLSGRLVSEVSESRVRDATLVGAVIMRAGKGHTLTSRLVTKSKALFAVQRGNQIIRLTTSTVVSLCCIRPIEE